MHFYRNIFLIESSSKYSCIQVLCQAVFCMVFCLNIYGKIYFNFLTIEYWREQGFDFYWFYVFCRFLRGGE